MEVQAYLEQFARHEWIVTVARDPNVGETIVNQWARPVVVPFIGTVVSRVHFPENGSSVGVESIPVGVASPDIDNIVLHRCRRCNAYLRRNTPRGGYAKVGLPLQKACQCIKSVLIPIPRTDVDGIIHNSGRGGDTTACLERPEFGQALCVGGREDYLSARCRALYIVQIRRPVISRYRRWSSGQRLPLWSECQQVYQYQCKHQPHRGE